MNILASTSEDLGGGLQVRGLCKRFGALAVTSNVSLSLRPGARAALIGPNGAGKTTLINLITGVLKPTAGQVFLNGKDVTRLSTDARARLGLFRSFQVTRLFKSLSVEDNVRLAVLQRADQPQSFWRPVRAAPGLDADVDHALGALHLRDRAARRVADLAYGEQRMVELAIAVAARPSILLLDEPAAGVPQSESKVIVEAIDALPSDIAVLLIEHDMDLVFRLANEITVLVAGSVLMHGTPAQVASDTRVRSLYLGERKHELE